MPLCLKVFKHKSKWHSLHLLKICTTDKSQQGIQNKILQISFQFWSFQPLWLAKCILEKKKVLQEFSDYLGHWVFFNDSNCKIDLLYCIYRSNCYRCTDQRDWEQWFFLCKKLGDVLVTTVCQHTQMYVCSLGCSARERSDWWKRRGENEQQNDKVGIKKTWNLTFITLLLVYFSQNLKP